MDAVRTEYWLVLVTVFPQMRQLYQPGLNHIIGGETNAHGNGALNPVHTKSLVEAVLDALLAAKTKVTSYIF